MPATGKRPSQKPSRFNARPGSGSKLGTTSPATVPAANKRRRTSTPKAAHDAMADAAAAAFAMSVDSRAAPGRRSTTDDRSQNRTQRAAPDASGESGDSKEEEEDGEQGEDSADGAAGEEGEEEGSEDDSDDDEDGGSEDSKGESESGSDSDVERAGQRKLEAASAPKTPKVSDKGRQGKEAVEAGGGKVKVGQGNKIRERTEGKPVNASTRGKEEPKVMLVIICDISQSGR